MKFDKWNELRVWIAGHGDAENPPMTAKEVFEAALEKMNELEEVEKRFNHPTPAFKPGDRVRHKKDETVYLGEVLEISKSGKTARVKWLDYDQRKYIFGPPWPTYYRLDSLEKVEEGESHEQVEKGNMG